MTRERTKSIDEIENEIVRNEIFKLMKIFPESFLNLELELVTCHPLKVRGKKVYGNVYFCTKYCHTKKDVQCKVLEWWSRDAHKTMFDCSETISEIVQNYVREGINRYLGTNFSWEDMSVIYDRLGNAIDHDLTIKFIDSGFDMKLLRKQKCSA